jgi:hypothetical protein
VIKIADKVGQAPIEETSPVLRTVPQLRLHSRTAFLRKSTKISPWKQLTGLGELLTYQHSRRFLVADLT